ncbi:MAG TPA: MOSC N-terminal beta barrel domain-containing protein [Chloroflexota bacterium]|nr:MOSC N-terminal beta barrel domain-containing protein [Chloroflexota bacterium]
MYVQELWRYPVKSLRGEPLARAELRADGVVGDRLVHVQNRRGFVTARTRPRLLGLQGSLDPHGRVLIDGRPWDDPQSLAAVRAAAGPDATLVADASLERFDVLPLLVATDGAIARFGFDGRRLRPNLIVGGVAGLAERSWPGRRLRIGEAVIGVDSLRGRCVMTTFDPDTLEQDLDVLRHIVRTFDGELALNCWVEQPGVIAVGDAVELL